MATGTKVFVLVVNPPGLTITTPSPLPEAVEGEGYIYNKLEAIGGTPPYTFTLVPGNALPLGLGLNPDGLIAGTPAAAGTYQFEIRVTDSAA